MSFAPDNCLAEYFGADGKMSKWPNGQRNKEELENHKNDLALLLQVLHGSRASGAMHVFCNFSENSHIVSSGLFFR